MKFYKKISKENNQTIELDILKNFLSLKIDSFPDNENIIEIYHKLLKK